MHKVEIFDCILWKILEVWKILVLWLMGEILRDSFSNGRTLLHFSILLAQVNRSN